MLKIKPSITQIFEEDLTIQTL